MVWPLIWMEWSVLEDFSSGLAAGAGAGAGGLAGSAGGWANRGRVKATHKGSDRRFSMLSLYSTRRQPKGLEGIIEAYAPTPVVGPDGAHGRSRRNHRVVRPNFAPDRPLSKRFSD